MPINKARCIRYKDTWAAPGSALHQALTDGNKKAAEKIYNECERRLAKEKCERTYFAADGTLMVTETGNRSIFDDVDE
ncbi:hypothetical protein [Burkholderia phage BCSR129]|nr:hypothetical protein [Burkholderia phage BCSR129]